jgi:hypothetical protein
VRYVLNLRLIPRALAADYNEAKDPIGEEKK